MLNKQIQNYKILSLLGQGGMATVYLAEHDLLGNQIAFKFLNKEFINNENIRKRFLVEARSMARMSHPNIVKVTDLIDDGDSVAFVMEYVEGETLKEYIERKGKLSDDDIKSIFSQMLDAVGYVHEQNLVHRDIKPSNFMVSPKGIVKLMDFGIAKNTDASSAEYTQTGTGVQMGTPMYMSPEQITETKNVTLLSDIYSLGVVLWQMITGEKPYDIKTLSTFQLQTKIVNESLPKTNSAWDNVIEKATEKENSNRFNSCILFKNYLNLNSNQEYSMDKTMLNFENTIIESVKKENDKIIKCTSCLGKGHIDWNDIHRLEKQNSWIPGKCDQCEGKGVMSENKKIHPVDVNLKNNELSIVNKVINQKKYESIKIGDQIWMTENLDVDRFRNGDVIHEAKTKEDWKRAGQTGQSAWCYYENNEENGKRHGKLYNWYAVNDFRGLAPNGWQIPTVENWKELIDFLGEEPGIKLKSKDFWPVKYGVFDFNGEDNFDFKALPSGIRNNNGYFNNEESDYWTFDTNLNQTSMSIALKNKFLLRTKIIIEPASKNYGFSVRCVRN